MQQDDINEAEWRDPANWSWRGPLGFYASKRDKRLLVPKALPMMGWTINFAHPIYTCILVAIALAPVALAAAIHFAVK